MIRLFGFIMAKTMVLSDNYNISFHQSRYTNTNVMKSSDRLEDWRSNHEKRVRITPWSICRGDILIST